jgi:hypothetical protein
VELSITFTLPKRTKDRIKLINEVEKELQKNGFKIISREIYGKEFLLVYENFIPTENEKYLDSIEEIGESKQKNALEKLYFTGYGLKIEMNFLLAVLGVIFFVSLLFVYL